MRSYTAFFKGQQIQVQAQSSYEAQQRAAVIFRARRAHEVTVILNDVPIDTAGL